jgi:hypothetical protein
MRTADLVISLVCMVGVAAVVRLTGNLLILAFTYQNVLVLV